MSGPAQGFYKAMFIGRKVGEALGSGFVEAVDGLVRVAIFFEFSHVRSLNKKGLPLIAAIDRWQLYMGSQTEQRTNPAHPKVSTRTAAIELYSLAILTNVDEAGCETRSLLLQRPAHITDTGCDPRGNRCYSSRRNFL